MDQINTHKKYIIVGSKVSSWQIIKTLELAPKKKVFYIKKIEGIVICMTSLNMEVTLLDFVVCTPRRVKKKWQSCKRKGNNSGGFNQAG